MQQDCRVPVCGEQTFESLQQPKVTPGCSELGPATPRALDKHLITREIHLITREIHLASSLKPKRQRPAADHLRNYL